MQRLLLRVLIILPIVIVFIAVIGPLLISQQPAPAHQPLHIDPTTATHNYLAIPYDGSSELRIHLRDSNPALQGSKPSTSFLLLHGFTFNLSTWDAMFEFFSAVGRSVAYDQLPYGQSDKPLPKKPGGDNPYTRATAAERAITLLEQLQLSGAMLVGNSSGATLALDVARQAPDRLAGLILISPWVYSKRPTLPEWLVNTPQMRRTSLLIARYLGNEMPLLERSYANPQKIGKIQREFAGSHRWTPGWDLAWGALLHRSLSETVTVSNSLSAIKLPTLIIAGAEDRIVKPQDSARAADSMPDAEFVLLPGCGHVPQEECPGQVTTVITNWLNKLQ